VRLCAILIFATMATIAIAFPTRRTSAQEPFPWSETIAAHTRSITDRAAEELAAVTKANWPTTQTQWRSELQEMLGLTPLPEKTDLRTTITGSITLDGLSVDRLHYQSRPGLYVTANLYKPVGPVPAAGWPAVLYVCGHARATEHGRLLGNKTGYQHHGIWLARHGVVCLMIDTIQLGEFHGEHHGTYKLGRWDWYSRGYTPAGVEAWNAVRGVDLLVNLPDVNAQRIGITGRSGGGAYSWFAAALDERIRVAVPVAGITDMHNHTVDGCVEGHCDCMYFVNYFDWDYSKLAALVAPRALLLANSDSDGIFPLDGVMRIHRQLAGMYDRLGAAENYGVLITPGPHKDTQELQVGAFKWLLKNLQDVEPVIDSAALKEIEPSELVAFKTEIPSNERVTSVSSWFVSQPKPVRNGSKAAELWSTEWLPELRRLGSVPAPDAPPPFTRVAGDSIPADMQLFSSGDKHSSKILRIAGDSSQPPVVHLIATTSDVWDSAEGIIQVSDIAERIRPYENRTQYLVRWRGAAWLAGASSVKQQNMLVRRLYLLGESPDELMLHDFVGALRWIASSQDNENNSTLELVGEGREAALVELAALLVREEEVSIAKLHLVKRTSEPLLAPALLGFLRVCDFESLDAAAKQLLKVDEGERQTSSASVLLVNSESEPQQATGMRIVEVDQDSAKFWVRATRWPLANLGDLPNVTFEKTAKGSKRNQNPILPEQGVDGLRFAVPGVPAQVRVGIRHGSNWKYCDWQGVSAATDYSAVIELDGLSPGTRYDVRTEVRQANATESGSASSSLSGSFQSLPAINSEGHFKLAVGTCQAFEDRDGPHGFDIYRTMQERRADAFVMAGDVVYYDALARSNELAFYHWQRTYSLPTLLEFHKRVPTYFLKDDHDTYMNDTWPGTSLGWTGSFTFEDGQRIFREQTGLPEQGYRTFQLTQDLQIWLMEGRDYRSPNNAPDGPEKSIWGKTQKEWLKKTMEASTATFRVVISPTPLVGPDRDNKSDNHSNKVFENEGLEVRTMLASYPNTVSVCGDRHWQYHSIDPQTGLHEFSVGPASDRHAGGWKQEDFRPEIHQFLRVAGGYLEIELNGTGKARQLELRHLDTRGAEQHCYTLH
jgi:dienelactone hydrolase